MHKAYHVIYKKTQCSLCAAPSGSIIEVTGYAYCICGPNKSKQAEKAPCHATVNSAFLSRDRNLKQSQVTQSGKFKQYADDSLQSICSNWPRPHPTPTEADVFHHVLQYRGECGGKCKHHESHQGSRLAVKHCTNRQQCYGSQTHKLEPPTHGFYL